MALKALADAHLLVEAPHGVLALELLQLFRRVLVQELVDAEETATNTNVDLVVIDLDHDALGSKLVDTLALTHKHNLQLLALGVVVDVLSDLLVNLVVLDGDVDRDPRLEINDVVLQVLNLSQVVLAHVLTLLKLSQKLEALHTRLVEFTFEVIDVLGSVGQLSLELLTGGLNALVLIFLDSQLGFDVNVHVELGAQIHNDAFKLKDSLVSLVKDILVFDLGLVERLAEGLVGFGTLRFLGSVLLAKVGKLVL